MKTKIRRFLKTKEVADVLQLNLLTIYSYIKTGKLPAVKFGRNIRINENDLNAFINANIVNVKKQTK